MDKSLILNLIKLHYKFKTDTDFAKFLGVTPQVLQNWKTRNTLDYDLLYTKCVDIDGNWLLTGKGKMLREEYAAELMYETTGIELGSTIPLVYPRAVGGFGNTSFTIAEKDIKEYYVVPKFRHKKVDFMIEVEGDSMADRYNSGDVVACTILKESSFIQWHKVHVIATREQGTMIKRIDPGLSEDNLCMISDNEKYKPFYVPKDEITGIAIVCGLIRLE